MSHIYEKATIRMRDGINLSAALFRQTGGSAPTLLMRSPYGIEIRGAGDTIPVHRLLNAGYNVVWVESRGTFASEGDFIGGPEEKDDGYDTVEWVIGQPWSDGTVGTYGLSYVGMTQWAIVASGHPAVRAIAPTVTAANWYNAPWYSRGGALSPHIFVPWWTIMRANQEVRALERGSGDPALLGKLVGEMQSGEDAFEHTPLMDYMKDLDARGAVDILERPTYDESWKSTNYADAIETLSAPALMITGWFDLFISDTLKNFEQVATNAASSDARSGSHLIVGPWRHEDPVGDSAYPDLDFGLAAHKMATDFTAITLKHFAQWLPVKESVISDEAPVRLFVMGANQWRDEQTWPLPDTEYRDYYLDADAASIDTARPTVESRATLVFDPKDPVPSRGGAFMFVHRAEGPVDQGSLDQRSDILRFETEPLVQATEVTGYVSATLFVSSDARDTDITARLIDVHPDGKALSVCDGILRLRYRDGLDAPKLLEPGQTYEVVVELDPTSWEFAEGHRIRVDVSSSNFPRYDVNTNTGGEISRESREDGVIARNTLHTGPKHPSRVILPIIDRD